jgi:SAM-dependent methyltransferase
VDVLKILSEKTNYSTTDLQLILGAWVLSTPLEKRAKISTSNGHIAEDDYTKQSIYALLYSLYRSVGVIRSDTGEPYEFTFNTWGYAWPKAWGPRPDSAKDPQRFGRNAYTGLYEFGQVKDYVGAKDGRVHVVELGCGTGAGAHHTCKSVLKDCTYEAVDMQGTAIDTCQRKFVPELGGRLVATHSDATKLSMKSEVADLVAICETHIAEHGGKVTDEDKAFFQSAKRIMKPGGFLVWGNAIPTNTWQPCFEYLDSIGMKLVEAHDVTDDAVSARDQDEGRIVAYVEHCLQKFKAFRIPVFGPKKRVEARQALLNFARSPGTQLYENMKDRTDSYRVALLQKVSNGNGAS